MPDAAAPDEKFLIRRKFFKLFGAGFHVYDTQGNLVAYCKQKAFKLREDLRIYTDEKLEKELLRISTNQIIDLSATYTVTAGEGNVLGSFKRAGLKSAFVRDEWAVFNPQGQQIATLIEESAFKAFIRRWVDYVAIFFPQKFLIKSPSGQQIGHMRQRFNPFIYQLGIAFPDPDDVIDDLLILALGCIVSAIEGRQA
ncbi:MAG: hypothetical protein ACOYN0_14770 [Phycisphaerales bacterium]